MPTRLSPFADGGRHVNEVAVMRPLYRKNALRAVLDGPGENMSVSASTLNLCGSLVPDDRDFTGWLGIFDDTMSTHGVDGDANGARRSAPNHRLAVSATL